MRKFSLSMVLLGLVSSQALASGVGNGGDPIASEYEDARLYAAQRVSDATECAFSVNVAPEVRDWILSNKDALAQDIQQTPYTWITDPQQTCGWTQTTRDSGITFSYEQCKAWTHDITDAIYMVVHESVHHFGFAEEAFPNAVADAVKALGLNSSCPGTPAQDPFNPASCPGTPLSSQGLQNLVPLPEANRRFLGKFAVFVRKRTCYSPNWCTNWQAVDSTPETFSMDASLPIKMSGWVYAELRNNLPEIDVVSDPGSDQWNGGKGNFDWISAAQVDQFDLESYFVSVNSATIPREGFRWGNVQLGSTRVGGGEGDTTRFRGWVTTGCMRQTVSGSTPTQDNLGNSIINQFEAVILSHFI